MFHSPALMAFDFLSLLKHEKDGRMRERLRALRLLQQGKSFTEVSRILDKCRSIISKWYSAFLKHGYAGLIDKPRSGRKAHLPKEQEANFVAAALELQKTKGGGRTTAKDFQLLLKDQFGVVSSIRSVYELLHRVNLSWTTGRPEHPKTNQKVQEEFKKNSKMRSWVPCQKA